MAHRSFSSDRGGSGAGSGTVNTVSAGNASIVISGTPTNPTVRTNNSATTPAAVGPAVAGTAVRPSAADHSHPVLTVANSAAMTALAVTDMPDGTPCYVASRDAIFYLETSTRTANTWDTFASATAGRQWLRTGFVSLKNAARTAWEINTTTGSDDATGAPGAPLKTVTELAWRLYGALLTSAVTATLIGNMPTTDKPYFSFQCSPVGGSFAFVGTPTLIYTSTITTYINAGAGPSTNQTTLADAAVPGGSFTAAGAMAVGVLGTRTNGTQSFFWFAKDNGATTARISEPSAALANGDTYTARQLPTVQQMRFTERRALTVSITTCLLASGTTWADSSVFFQRCWFQSSAMGAIGFLNCAWSGSNTVGVTFGNYTYLVISTGGLYRGTGTTSFQLGGFAQGKIGAKFTVQGARLNVQSVFVEIAGDILFYDYTGSLGLIAATYWGLVYHSAGGIIGSGNTSYLYYAGNWSQISYLSGAPAVAGSTTNATPIHATGSADVTVGGLPLLVNAQQNGVFQST